MSLPRASALERLTDLPREVAHWSGVTAYLVKDNSAAPRYVRGDIIVVDRNGEEIAVVPTRDKEAWREATALK